LGHDSETKRSADDFVEHVSCFATPPSYYIAFCRRAADLERDDFLRIAIAL